MKYILEEKDVKGGRIFSLDDYDEKYLVTIDWDGDGYYINESEYLYSLHRVSNGIIIIKRCNKNKFVDTLNAIGFVPIEHVVEE
jgi:hypothetical protein